MFHQVITNLRRRDWTTVAIDLLVVIVGVFIGVQASNWNAERETNLKAVDFSERLKSDLREEAWGYELQIRYYSEVLDNARHAADALSDRSPLSDEVLLVSAYRATQYNGNIRRRTTYDELTSTGEIGLIRDQSLRDLAMRVYSVELFEDMVHDAQHSQYRMAFRKAIPHEIQATLAQACGDRIVPVGDYNAIPQSLDYPCATGLSSAALANGVAILRSDSELQPLLRLRIADIQTDLGNLTEYNKKDVWDPLRALAGKTP
jgi:hypothetical protein